MLCQDGTGRYGVILLSQRRAASNEPSVGALFFASGIFLKYRSMALACLGCKLWSAFEWQMVMRSLNEELVACT